MDIHIYINGATYVIVAVFENELVPQCVYCYSTNSHLLSLDTNVLKGQ